MIKKHRNRNQYFYASEGLWVRDFTRPNAPAIDINDLVPSIDIPILLENENTNQINSLFQRVDTESFSHPNVVILNSGYGFKDFVFKTLPQTITSIGVNETLSQWNSAYSMNYYVINNPYKECLRFLQGKKTQPRCIASTRTHPSFLKEFNGMIYLYTPAPSTQFSGINLEADYFIDDYRNPICASIGLAYKFGVKKLLLLFPDEIYDQQRAGTYMLPNKKWIYPQQHTSQRLIDGNLFWLKNAGVKVGHIGYGPDYKNSTFCNDITQFFAN